jgi:hypothetical protein
MATINGGGSFARRKKPKSVIADFDLTYPKTRQRNP